jgi:hypothetical protein
MPIAEIIHEIDAYLLRLRQARELLSGRIREVPQKKLPRRKKKVGVTRTDPTPSTKRQASEKNSRSNRPVAHRKEEKGLGDPAAWVSSALPLSRTASTKQSTIVQLEPTIPQTLAITRLPASRRMSSVRSFRDRNAKGALRSSPEPGKPATALSGSTNARIVVVSAEQVQREREQAAQPVARRPRIPASRLSGRLAFEALFADPTDSSKS